MTNLDDAVTACADLIGRAGASSLEIGYLNDDVPADQASWYAHAQYRGARIIAQDHKSPTDAALALAQQLLHNAACRCGQTVTLTDQQNGCRWKLIGGRWEPGCDAPPIDVPAGHRGDRAAMAQALSAATSNRAARRVRERVAERTGHTIEKEQP